VKKAYLTEIGKMEVKEEPVPEIGKNEVLVKVKYAGICGSDLHYYRNGGLGSFKKELPLSLGHEISGVIEDPNDIPGVQKGDRVAIEPRLHCGYCYFCRSGRENLCMNRRFIGADLPGGMAEYINVHATQIVKLHDKMSLKAGVMLEPMTIAMHAIDRANPELGAKVAVIGQGTIGILIAKLSNYYGSEILWVADKDKDRTTRGMMHTGAQYGLDDAWTGKKSDRFASVVYEAVGKQETIDRAFEYARSGAKVVLVGIPEVDYIQYNPHLMRIKELDVINVRNSNVPLQDAMFFYLARGIDIESLVTHEFEIDRVNDAFAVASSYNMGNIKTVLVFD